MESNVSSYNVLLIDDTRLIHDDFKSIFEKTNLESSVDILEKDLFKEIENESKSAPQLFDEISITSAFSGEEGIDIIKTTSANNKHFAVVIIDVRMPGGIDGIETAREIFKIESNVQIVICTAYSDYEWSEIQQLLKYKDRWLILKKPFEVIEARQMVISLCHKWSLITNMKVQIASQIAELEKINAQLVHDQKKIKYLAYHDSLTGLPNRALFFELLKKSMALAKSTGHYLGLIFLDLDGFKKINDIHGHIIGDEILCAVVDRIQSSIRSSDYSNRVFSEDRDNFELLSASRLGGDEFTIIINNYTNESDIKLTADRILRAISDKSYHIKDIELKVSASIGVAIYPLHSEKMDELLQFADISMYCAKKFGKNQVVFHESHRDEEVIKRDQLENDLCLGLDKKELFFEFQPIISLGDGKICSFEALIRWSHPKLGLIYPKDIIPVAEKINKVIHIDNYVLNTVSELLSKWQQHPILNTMIVSINISAKYLDQKDCFKNLIALIDKFCFNPQKLRIEITEAYLISSKEDLSRSINELARSSDYKVQFLIDDFGTGFSTMDYLIDLPINLIKIDRSFIRKIVNDKNVALMVKSMIQLCHKLNKAVIAEGLESQEELVLLSQMKCDQVQGFLLEKPMPSEKICEFVKNWDPSRVIKK